MYIFSQKLYVTTLHTIYTQRYIFSNFKLSNDIIVNNMLIARYKLTNLLGFLYENKNYFTVD